MGIKSLLNNAPYKVGDERNINIEEFIKDIILSIAGIVQVRVKLAHIPDKAGNASTWFTGYWVEGIRNTGVPGEYDNLQPFRFLLRPMEDLSIVTICGIEYMGDIVEVSWSKDSITEIIDTLIRLVELKTTTPVSKIYHTKRYLQMLMNVYGLSDKVTITNLPGSNYASIIILKQKPDVSFAVVHYNHLETFLAFQPEYKERCWVANPSVSEDDVISQLQIEIKARLGKGDD